MYIIVIAGITAGACYDVKISPTSGIICCSSVVRDRMWIPEVFEGTIKVSR